MFLLVVPPLIIGPWAVMSQFSQQVVIEQAVGPDAWERGVHVIDDDGTLSNGIQLSPLWNSLIDPGGLILAIGISSLPAFVWSLSAGPPLTEEGLPAEHARRTA